MANIKYNISAIHSHASSVRSSGNIDLVNITKDTNSTANPIVEANNAIDKLNEIVSKLNEAVSTFASNLDEMANSMQEADNNA